MINDFLPADCVRVLLPAISADQNKVLPPSLSEVCGILVLPMRAAPPSSWVSSDAIENAADNTVTDNSSAKWITGIGDLPRPEDIIIDMGKDERRIGRRLFSLEFEVNVRCDPELSFVRTFQQQYRSFKFWIATRGGRFLGSQRGIFPKFVTAWAPYERGEIEKAFIQIDWYADGSPARATTGGLFTGGAGDEITPTPVSNVMFYQDVYPSQVSSTLTWTENSGVLPAVNTAAQILVFQNGQKLEETIQYTINHLTGPSESEIVIGALTHFSGANYEVLAIVTS